MNELRVADLEIERHARADGLGLVAGNHVVVGIATAHIIAVTAGAHAVMRAGAVAKIAVDQIPAHEWTEAIFDAG